MVKLTEHRSLSHETVRRRLAENGLKPWRKDMWCIPQVDGEYVARMEDVLDLYAEAPDPKRPVVCFYESRCSSSARRVSRSRPGQVSSNVTITSIVAMARSISSSSSMRIVPGARSKSPNGERRKTMPDACTTLSTSIIPMPRSSGLFRTIYRPTFAGALYQAFPPAEARRILRRVEFHYTPKHASWLNMVEIEIGVLRGQCLDRRIDDSKRLRREIAVWERKRNAARSRIKRMFTTDKARAKMGRAYPATSKES
jgi:hypothetical protein